MAGTPNYRKQKFPLADCEVDRAPGLLAVMTGEFRSPKAGEWFISGAIPEAYFAVQDYAPSTHYYIAKLIDPAHPEKPTEGWAICRPARGEDMDLFKCTVFGQDSPPYLTGRIRYKIKLADGTERHVLHDRFFVNEKTAAETYATLLENRIDEMQNKVRKLRERSGA